MANWKTTLDIKDIWGNEYFSAKEKGEAIARRLRYKFSSLLNYGDDNYNYELDAIVEAFESITGYDDTTPTEEFDEWMDALYDWADSEVAPFGQWPANKMCWIITS